MLSNLSFNARPLVLTDTGNRRKTRESDFLPVSDNETTCIDTTNTISSFPASTSTIPQCAERCFCSCHMDCAYSETPDTIRKRKRNNNPVNEVKRAMYRKKLKNEENTYLKENNHKAKPLSSSTLSSSYCTLAEGEFTSQHCLG
jgi:hypothetical protein